MAEPRWLKGTLTGRCEGKPTRKRGGSGLARWYKLELVEAVIGDWAAVVLASAWTHRMRTRRRTPPGIWGQILQGAIGLLLILAAAGVVIGLADRARATSCNDPGALMVLASMATVIGTSLLSIS